MSSEEKLLVEILKKEEVLLNQIKSTLSEYEKAIISKDLTLLSNLLDNLYLAVEEFETVEEQRNQLFERIKSQQNLPSELTFYSYALEREEVMKSLFEVVKQMNEISLLTSRLKDILDFNLNYIETLISALVPSEKPTYDQRANISKNPAKGNFEFQG
ncbi:flagellar export chaperone FlgN [Pseudothermotoga thermarum]|uniref:FlgN family protein n=1 Tax=Pseudothermotoga thermarum DSM 5069 TaxID=688269 RepID=F7YYV0_9THEM|nr:flagellar export chaperone FlgN [Pseudothermotoga thermarum]AEH51143.1 hypothetical protein Theth_1063 [Pseudothermotoga thermarum DSM 5069]